MTFGLPNCTRLGAAAIVFAVEPERNAQTKLRQIARRAKTWHGVREAVLGDANLTLLCDVAVLSCDEAERNLEHAWQAPIEAADASRLIDIPVRYGGSDGPDLPEVAERCGLDEASAIDAHAGAEYVVAFMGFQPGFAYLHGLPAPLELPRRMEPRTRVPAGSVAIAGALSAVYPFDSPGGWHVIGRSDLRLFDPSHERFTLLEPGDRVRFVPR